MHYTSPEPFKDFTRGGQTTLHNIRMMFQIVRKLCLVFLAVFISYNVFWWFKGGGLEHFNSPIFSSWINAQVRLFFGQTNESITFEPIPGVRYLLSPENFLQHPIVLSQINTLKNYFKDGLFFSTMAGLSSCGLMIQLLWSIGKKQRKPKIVRGMTLVDNHKLKQILNKSKLASNITLAGIPILNNSERAHFLISGTPGTGKSVCMAELLDQVRAKKQRAIVYDRVGDFVSYYYRPEKDIILNPLDARCPSWHVWNECRDASDYDALAAALMPLPPGNYDPFWINAARTIFSSTAYQMSFQDEKNMGLLFRYLLTADLNTLTSLLKGTEAEMLVSEKIEKTALSVRTVLSTYLKSFKYLKEGTSPFSIRDWVQEEKEDSWLFITSRADKHESLKPLISAWLEIAGSSLMSLLPNQERRVWMSLDELPSLHRLPYISTLLAESRKFGGCLIATVQSIAQLRDIYGMNAAEAMSGLCNTRIFFRTPEPMTAEWVSKSLGECEIDEPREGFSYGANTIRDGVSINRQKVIRPLIMPSEITQLPDLHAYLKLPGDWPVTQLKFNYKERKAHEPAMVEGHHTQRTSPLFEEEPMEANAPKAGAGTETISMKEARNSYDELERI